MSDTVFVPNEAKAIRLMDRVKAAVATDKATKALLYPSGPPAPLMEEATAAARELRSNLRKEREHVQRLIDGAGFGDDEEEYNSAAEEEGFSAKLYGGAAKEEDEEDPELLAAARENPGLTVQELKARRQAALEDLRPSLERKLFTTLTNGRIVDHLRDGLMLYGTFLVNHMHTTNSTTNNNTIGRQSKAALAYTKEYLRLLGELSLPSVRNTQWEKAEEEQLHKIRSQLAIDKFFQFLVDVISPLLVRRGTVGSLPDADVTVVELTIRLVQNLIRGKPKAIEPLIGVLCRTDCLAFIILIVQQNCHIRVNITQKEEQLLMAREAQRTAVSEKFGGYNKAGTSSKQTSVAGAAAKSQSAARASSTAAGGGGALTPRGRSSRKEQDQGKSPLAQLVGTPSRKVPLSPVPPKGLRLSENSTTNQQNTIGQQEQPVSGVTSLLQSPPSAHRSNQQVHEGASVSPGRSSAAAPSRATGMTGYQSNGAATVVSEALADQMITQARNSGLIGGGGRVSPSSREGYAVARAGDEDADEDELEIASNDEEDALEISDADPFSVVPKAGDSTTSDVLGGGTPRQISNTLQEPAVAPLADDQIDNAAVATTNNNGNNQTATLIVDGTLLPQTGSGSLLGAPGTPQPVKSGGSQLPGSPVAPAGGVTPPPPMITKTVATPQHQGVENDEEYEEEDEELLIEDEEAEEEEEEVEDPKARLRRLALELAEQNQESKHQLTILRRWNWLTLEIVTLVFRCLTADQLQLLTGQSMGASSHRVAERLRTAFGEAFLETEHWKKSAKTQAGPTASSTLLVRRNVKRPRDTLNPEDDQPSAFAPPGPNDGELLEADGLAKNNKVVIKASAVLSKDNRSRLEAARQVDAQKKASFNKTALVHPMDISTMPLATQMHLVRHYTGFLNAGFEELAEMLWPEVKKKMQQTVEELQGVRESKQPGYGAVPLFEHEKDEIDELANIERDAMKDIFNYMQLCTKLLYFTRQIVLSVRTFITQTQQQGRPLDANQEFTQAQMLSVLQLHSRSVFGLLTLDHFSMAFLFLSEVNTNNKMRKEYGTSPILAYLTELTYLLWHTARGDLSGDEAVTKAAENLAVSILAKESGSSVRGLIAMITKNIKQQGAPQIIVEKHVLYTHAFIHLLAHCSFNGQYAADGYGLRDIVTQIAVVGSDMLRIGIRNWRINSNNVNLALADLLRLIHSYEQHYIFFNMHFLLIASDVLQGASPTVLAMAAGKTATEAQQQNSASDEDHDGLRQLYQIIDLYVRDFFTPKVPADDEEDWRFSLALRCIRATIAMPSNSFLSQEHNRGWDASTLMAPELPDNESKKKKGGRRKKKNDDSSDSSDAEPDSDFETQWERYQQGLAAGEDGGEFQDQFAFEPEGNDVLDKVADAEDAKTRAWKKQIKKQRREEKKREKQAAKKSSKKSKKRGVEEEEQEMVDLDALADIQATIDAELNAAAEAETQQIVAAAEQEEQKKQQRKKDKKKHKTEAKDITKAERKAKKEEKRRRKEEKMRRKRGRGKSGVEDCAGIDATDNDEDEEEALPTGVDQYLPDEDLAVSAGRPQYSGEEVEGGDETAGRPQPDIDFKKVAEAAVAHNAAALALFDDDE